MLGSARGQSPDSCRALGSLAGRLIRSALFMLSQVIVNGSAVTYIVRHLHPCQREIQDSRKLASSVNYEKFVPFLRGSTGYLRLCIAHILVSAAERLEAGSTELRPVKAD